MTSLFDVIRELESVTEDLREQQSESDLSDASSVIEACADNLVQQADYLRVIANALSDAYSALH